ncbi:hypothetical protein VTN77DRAFT_8226 [Rasamsonia byssochlamydoides]|uniref:uncharacterized protein n=1 Tax=Rasamsonia byssochlamydoides TaxID=89139 RepID=UPI0037437E5A
MAPAEITPEVTWAQRSSDSDATRNFLYVSLNVPDVPKSSADLNITASTVSFTGTNMKGIKYHVSLELYAEIDPENSKVNHTARGVELVLRKKELKKEYWPRLLKETKKVHFLKTDFDKWVDEDEQDEVDDDYAANFGGFGDEGGLGNIDFSKLGGGSEDLSDSGEGGEEDEDEDDELPELEGDTPKPPKDTKVEESEEASS